MPSDADRIIDVKRVRHNRRLASVNASFLTGIDQPARPQRCAGRNLAHTGHAWW
jgi:hypothetical protein